jgi:uncharacterized protein (DUF3084 family)
MSSKLAEITARFEAADAAAAAASTETTPPETTQETAAGEEAAVETPGEATPAAAAGTDPGAAAPAAAVADDAPPPWWDKALQREQQERANITRDIQTLRETITQQGAATPAQAKQLEASATNLQVSNDRLAKIKGKLGKDFDAFEKGGEVLGDLTDAMGDHDTRLRQIEAENQQLRQRLEARDQQEQTQAQARQFWPRWESQNAGIPGEKLWIDTVQELSERGYQGDRLAGAAEILWQSKVDAAKAAKSNPAASATNSAAPAPTASSRGPAITPGGAQIVASGSGARPPAVKKSAQQMIDDGDVDFFGGKYVPKS